MSLIPSQKIQDKLQRRLRRTTPFGEKIVKIGSLDGPAHQLILGPQPLRRDEAAVVALRIEIDLNRKNNGALRATDYGRAR